MRILLWHGYLLGGTGSNVYTRQLAREWARAGHDVTVLCQEPHPGRYDLGGADGGATRRAAGCCPSSCSTATRGTASSSCRTARAKSSTPGWRRTRAAVRERSPGRPRLLQPRAARRRGGPRGRSAVRRQGARLGARVLDARAPGARGMGREVLASGDDRVRRLGAHPRGARGRVRARRTACTRCLRAWTSTSGVRVRATRRSRGCSTRRVATRRTPATRTSDCPTRATPTGSPRSSPRTCPTVVYFGKLLAQQGRSRSARGARRGVDARAVVVGFGDHRRRARAAGRSRAHALHRPVRAPPPRPPARAGGRLRRAVDLPGGVRDGRRGGGRGRLPAARRATLGPRRGRGRAGGRVPVGPAPPRGIHDRRRRTSCRQSSPSCSRCRHRHALGDRERPRVVRRSRGGAGTSVADRLLELGR